MDLIEELQLHVSRTLLQKATADAVAFEEDLSRMLDSMQFILLARHVEDTYRIEVADDEISLDHFGSLRTLAGFIQRKQG